MISKTVLAVLMSVVIVGPLLAESPVYIPDDILRAAIEDKLGIIDPTPTDMLGLTSLRQSMERDTQMDGIRDITGIEYATNLQDLKLRLNQITNISALADLVNLQGLDLSENEIDSISALSGLSNLYELNIHANNIDDVTNISGLEYLYELDIHNNQITDPSPLADLKRLIVLDLHENPISDISSLNQFPSLIVLDLRFNPLNEEAYSYYIPSIISRNPGIDLTYIASIASPDVSPIQLTASNGLYLDSVRVSWGKANNGPGYTTRYRVYRAATNQPSAEISVSGWQSSLHYDDTTAEPGTRYNYWIDIAAERIVNTSTKYLYQSNTDTGWTGEPGNTARPSTLYVDDNAPDDPGPADATVSDPDEDGTIGHPFDSIQEAIERADYDTTVSVRPGTYYECLNMMGKNILLTSFDPKAKEIAPYPIIDPEYTGAGVTFSRGEDHRCTVSGFVITRGCGNPASGIACLGSSPTIRNCVIVGNRFKGTCTSAIFCFDSRSTFENCTISDNYNGDQGAGLRIVDCNVSVTNSIMFDINPIAIRVESGNDPIVSYSNIQGSWSGPGNLSEDPQFASPGYWTELPYKPAGWTAGDYHLKSQAGRWDPATQNWVTDTVTSACIDAGNPNHLGVYGQTSQASLSMLVLDTVKTP